MNWVVYLCVLSFFLALNESKKGEFRRASDVNLHKTWLKVAKWTKRTTIASIKSKRSNLRKNLNI